MSKTGVLGFMGSILPVSANGATIETFKVRPWLMRVFNWVERY